MSKVSQDAIREQIEAELAGPLRALELDLEAVEITPAGKRRILRVSVDKDGGVTLDDVADATREVSRVLDDSDVMGEQPYTLEVTSRGVDKPLTLPRHWRRNPTAWSRSTLADGDDRSPGGSRPVRRRRGLPRRRRHACVRSPTPTSPRRRCRSSSTAPGRRRPDGHRPEHPSDAGAGEGDLLRRPRRGDRAGAADGVPQDAGRAGAGAGGAGPQERPRDGAGRGGRRGGQPASASTTTRPTASAGSRRRPRSRSCCSGCATPRTTSGSASSPARRATSSRA